jgi:hypothetical protein
MFFRKNKQTKQEVTDERVAPLIQQHNSALEIVAHKSATHEAKKDIDEANAKLKEIFDRNHFTIKIYLANQQKQTKVAK